MRETSFIFGVLMYHFAAVQQTSIAKLEEIGFYFNIPLYGFNNNVTTTSFHHTSDNSTILKKKYKRKYFLKKEQTCRTLLPGQTVIDFMLQLTCYNGLHLVEWAAKIQIFGVT